MSAKTIRGMFAAICAVAAVMANAATISYTANTTVSEPLELEEDTAISVSSGKTVVYDANAIISGNYALRKIGTGKLILAGANTFTEGVTISEGSLMASNSLALGTGDVTILGQRDGYSGHCRLEIAGAGSNETFVVTIANNVNVTGTSTFTYPALVVYGQNAVLSGNVNASADFAYYDDDGSAKAIWAAYSSRWNHVTSLTFSGNITVAGAMITDGWTTFLYTGTVSAGSFDHSEQRTSSNHNQTHEFSGPVTIAGDFANSRQKFWFKNGFTAGGNLYWKCKTSSLLQGMIYLGTGTDVTIGSFETDTNGKTRNDEKDDWVFNFSEKKTPADYGQTEMKTLTIKGPDRVNRTPTNVVSEMRFMNKLSIEVDAYEGFMQTFTATNNNISGTLAATCGGITVGSVATFPEVTAVTVGENGVFSNESAQALSLGSVTNLTVDGEFASSTIPFANDGTVSLSIGANGSVTFPEDCTITLDTLTLNGVIQAPRTYSKGSLAQVHGANLLVMNGAESATATWDGDGDVNEPSNWEGGSLPELTHFATAPTFAAGGTHADINTDVQFNGIAFSAPAGTDGFELRGAGGGIQVGAGGISLDGTDLETARRYTISAPLDVIASQTWSVPSNQTLAIDNALTNINGIVTVEGSRGRIELKGTNTFAGAFISTATVFEVSGLVATPGHVPQGAAVVNGANTMTILGVYPLGSTTKSSGNLYVSNAVIEKPLYITYSGDGGINSRAGTTNVFMGDIQWQPPGMSFVIGKNSELVFRGGFTTGWSFRPTGTDLTSVMRICDTPATATASTGWNITRGKLSIEVPGNRIKILSTGGKEDYTSSYTNILLDLTVSYAFSDAQNIALMNGFYYSNSATKMKPKEKGYAEIDLNGTTQRVATLCGSVISKFKGGESPALSPPTGRTDLTGSGVTSFNMNTTRFMANTWPRPNDGQLGGRFLHSDIKNIAYFFVHPVFQKIVEVGWLNQ